MEIHYDNTIKERFIPIDYEDILLGYLKYFNNEDNIKYKELSKLIHHYYYQEFYDDLQNLKQSYQPFNPDSDILLSSNITQDEYKRKEELLFKQITPLLNHANYETLTQESLFKTMNKKSPYGVEVSVDFKDFDKIELYFRGESTQTEIKRDPLKLYLKTKTIVEPVYRRLFLIIKPKQLSVRAKEIAQETNGDIKKIKKKLLRTNPLLITDESNRNIYIKLFKNIPQMDLEMLFPNTKVKMTLFDKIKLSVVGGGGTLGGGATLIPKLTTAMIDPISALIAVGAFGGVVWRQVKNVIFRKTYYMAQLAKNLYFHSLDNNAGVLNYMIDMAGEEESKEALLVYLFLSNNTTTMTKENLDRAIEKYVKEIYNIEMDFEVDDGIRKLRNLGFLIEKDGKLSVVGLDKAISKIKGIL
jgi:hypothetical protein